MLDLSDTPAGMIARLDNSLARRGETVSVTKYGDDGAPTTLTGVRASVRPSKPEELIASIDQSQFKVVLSPTGNSTVLPLRKGDKFTRADGKQLNVEFPAPIYVGDTLVRINLTVAG
jgi:hypothetical protein